jgi:peptidoglycan/xylan/chitin deacetylase (PgdA/CDA1 family)
VLDLISPQMFLGPAQRRLFKRGMPVFTYHNIAEPPPGARDPFLYVSPARFAEQLEMLQNRGFTGVSLDDIINVSPKAENKVVITFDDGCRNVSQNALEILGRHGFCAIQFIVADLIGKRNEWDAKNGDVVEPLMDATQIREWLSAGHYIGSHSLTHPNLAKLGPADARPQIFDSKKKLEDLFGIPIRHFCYPHGRWTPEVRDMVRDAGYVSACTTEFGVNTAGTPCFELKRIFCLSESELLGKVRHRLRRRFGG